MNYRTECIYQGFNLCNADPAAFAYDDADSLVASVSSVANPRKKTCRPRNVEDDEDAEDTVLSNVLKNFNERLKRNNDSDASVEARKMLYMAREEEKYEQEKLLMSITIELKQAELEALKRKTN